MSNTLPFVGPLIEGSYFLEPEELFGMKYALMHEGWPIPLKFYSNFPIVDHPIPGKKYQIIYTCYRPIDTYILHKYFSSMKFYSYNIDPIKVQISALTSNMNINRTPEKRPFVGMRPGIAPNLLQFDSKFENGNLDRVVVISDKEYDLYIRSDTNSRKRFSWFFFGISNCKGKGIVRFNIVNLTDSPALYEIGMKPVVSVNKKEWDSYCVLDVEYVPSKLNQFLKVRYKSNFYMLTFDINFTNEETIWLARSIPYRYSKLLKSLTDFSASGFIKHRQLCKSIGGLHVPKLTITNFDMPKMGKKYVLIAARFNPGETSSSYITEGIIQFLLNNSPEAQQGRNNFIFKIIPMCNPEGVVIGNSRSTITGISIHQKYSEFTEIFATEPKYLKRLAYKLHSRLGIHMYLEVTGSFTNYGGFLHYPKDGKRGLVWDQFIEEYMNRNSVFARVTPKGVNLSESAFPMRRCLEKDLRIFTAVSENSVFGYRNNKGLFLSNDVEVLKLHGNIIAESIIKHFQLSKEEPKKISKFVVKSIKSDKYHISDSESSDSYQGSDPNLSMVLKKSLKSKSLLKDYQVHISSDDEDLQAKDHLLESFQEFCKMTSSKKFKKKLKNFSMPEPQKHFYLDSTVNSNKMIIIRKKPKKILQKSLKSSQKLSKNQSFSLNPIIFSKCCTGYKSISMPKAEPKPPQNAYFIYKKQEKHEDEDEVFEIPKKPELSQTKSNLIPKFINLPKFHKFGPFPNLQLIKQLKLKAALNL